MKMMDVMKYVVMFAVLTLFAVSYLGTRVLVMQAGKSAPVAVSSASLSCIEVKDDLNDAVNRFLTSDTYGILGRVGERTIKLDMDEIYADKDNCEQVANNLLANGLITGMTKKELTAEIYTHAFFYYVFDGMPEFVHELPVLSKVYNSVSNGIDLENGGDTQVRKVAYAVIYTVF